jgi:hypothetical protein
MSVSTEVGLCELALSKIGYAGSNKLTGSTVAGNSDTDLGRTLNLHYDNTLKELVSEYNWSYFTTKVALVIATNEVAGHTYTYDHPYGVNYGFIHAISDEFNNPIVDKSCAVDFEIYYDDTAIGSRVIGTSLADAYFWSINLPVTIANWPISFVNCFTWRLAAILAIALKADPRLAEYAQEQYTKTLMTALALCGNQHGTRPAYVPQTISAIIS